MDIESPPKSKPNKFESKEFSINEALSCEVESEEELSIHLSIVNVNKNAQDSLAFLLKSGLERLAEMLEKESRLKKIQTITATSWIVAKHPGLLKKAGFTLNSQDSGYTQAVEKYKSLIGKIAPDKQGIEPRRAVISKDELIKRYRKYPFIFKSPKEDKYY